MSRSNSLALVVPVLGALLFACQAVAPDNAFDPGTPVAKQVKGTIHGLVIADAAFDEASLEVVIDGIAARGGEVAAAKASLLKTDAGTAFKLEVPGGTYRIIAKARGFTTAEKGGVPVPAGTDVDAGTLTLVAGRGVLRGRILAQKPEEGVPPITTKVTLLRLVAPVDASGLEATCTAPELAAARAIELAADGSFTALDLATGPYMVAAEAAGYVPAMSARSVEVTADAPAVAPDLVLRIATNIARVETATNPAADPAATATSTREITVLLQRPPVYNAVRISEDPTFSDIALGSVDYVKLDGERHPFTLQKADGLHRVYVQFRSPTCQESPIYETTVVVDSTKPEVPSVRLAAGATCSTERVADLSVTASDAPCGEGGGACAGIYRMRLFAGELVPADAPWVPYAALARVELPGDGLQPVAVQVSDRAGNTSETGVATVLVNTTGPAVRARAISIDGGAASVHRRLVQLRLNVDGATWLELGSASGLDGSRWLPFPAGGIVSWELEDGEDGDRQVFARFRDDCGNVTDEVSALVELDRSARLRGSVRFAGRTEHAGLTVTALRKAEDGTYAETGRTTTTAADGAFAFTQLAPGAYRVLFSASGYASRRLDDVAVGEGADVALSELTLDRARGGVKGVARLGAGASHGGISVALGNAGSTTTDDTGAFTIDGVPVGNHTLVARRDRFRDAVSQAPVEVVEGTTVDAGTLTLEPLPAGISGSVRLEGRDEAAGVSLALSQKGESGEFVAVGAATQTGAEGTYAFTGLVPGTYRIRASITDFVSQSTSELKLGAADAVLAPTLALALARGDIEGVAKIAGATDHSGISVSTGTTTATTDAEGNFRFASIAVGSYQLRATLPRHAPASTTALVVVREGQKTAVPALTLQPLPGVLSGGVVLEGRSEAANVDVVLLAPDAAGEFVATPKAARTASNGRFAMTEIAPGTYRLRYARDGYTTATSADLVIEPQDDERLGDRVLAIARGTLGGTVELAGESTHGGATVTTASGVSTTTETAGTWAISGLAVGRHRVTATRAGSHAAVTSAEFEVKEGETTTVPKLTLAALPARIRGIARLANTADHAGVTAKLFVRNANGGYDDANRSVATAADGSFEIAALVKGTYRVTLAKEGFVGRSFDGLALSSGGEAVMPEVTLAVARGALKGVAQLQGESAHDGIVVSAGPGISVLTDRDGSYQFNDLPVGSYVVRAAKGTAYLVTQAASPAVVTEGAVAEVATITLPTNPGRVRGTVELANVTDFAGVNVLLDGFTVGGATARPSTTTNSEGAFAFTNVTAGTYTITFSAPGYRTQRQAGVVVGAAADLDLGEFTLPPSTGRLIGKATLAGTTSSEGVRVAASLGTIEAAVTATNAAGDWVIDALPVGSYNVTFSALGFGTKRLTGILVSADASTSVAEQTLAQQVGDATLKNVTGATNQRSYVVSGSYPETAKVRVCEDPAVTDPNGFSTSACDFVTPTFVSGGARWEAPAKTFKAQSACAPNACDGAKRVYVQVLTVASQTSSWFEIPVVLDTVAPAVKVVISPVESSIESGQLRHDGETYSRTTQVSVALEASDATSGVVSGRLYRSPSDATPLVFATANGLRSLDNVALTAGADGVRQIYSQVFDAAGNASSTSLSSITCPGVTWATGASAGACDAIFLDTTAPNAVGATPVRFAINPAETSDFSSGAAFALSPLVSLGVNSTATNKPEDEAREAIIANDANFESSVTQVLGGPKALVPWFLTSGDGPKTVYLKLRDRAGNLSQTLQRSITLDTSPPDVPVPIAVGAATNRKRPTLAFGGVAGANGYVLQLSPSASFEATASGFVQASLASSATSYTPAADLADGAWFWRVRATEASGQQSAYSNVDRFVLDTQPPAAPQILNLPAYVVAPARPEIQWTKIDEAASYEIELDTFVPPATGSDFSSPSRIQATSRETTYRLLTISDGAWSARVRALDSAGNPGAWSAVANTVVDTQRPSNPAVTAPAANAPLGQSLVTLSWGAVSDAVSYVVQLGTDPALAGASEYATRSTTLALALTDGPWTFRVGAVDAAGNRSDLSAALSRTFTIDTTAPDAPVPTLLPTLVTTRTPTLQWTNESASGAVRYELLVDSTTTAIAAATTTSHTIPPAQQLADGAHAWSVTSVDAAGNRASSPAQGFTVDATAPAAPSSIDPVASPTNDARPVFSWAFVSDAIRYEVEWDKAGSFNTVAKGAGSAAGNSLQPPTALSEGGWFVRVRALDAASNASPWTTAVQFTVDLTLPAAPVPTAPPADAVRNTTTVTLAWNAVADASSYVVDLSPTPDFSAYERTPGIAATSRAFGFADGDHYWRVLARDAAGNLSSTSAIPGRKLTIDTVAPGSPTLTSLAAVTKVKRPTFAWSRVTAAQRYRLTVGQSSVLVSDPGTGTSVSQGWGSDLADATYAWTVAAIDAADNEGVAAPSQSFTVDTLAPEPPSFTSAPPAATATTQPTLAWSQPAGATAYDLEWDTLATFGTSAKKSAQVTTTVATLAPALTAGPWFVRVRALDVVANASAWSTPATFTVDTTEPSDATVSSPAEGATVRTSSVTVSWAAVSDAVSYRLDVATDSSFSVAEQYGGITGTSRSISLGEGTFHVRVLATDAAGNVSKGTSTRSFTVDTKAPDVPVTTAIASPTREVRPGFVWSSTSGSGATSYLLRIDGVVQRLTTTSYTPSADLADGPHAFEVAAVDAAGNESDYSTSRSFEIDSTKPPTPVLVAVASPSSSQSQTLAFATVADAVSYTLERDTSTGFNTANKVSQSTTGDRVSATGLAEGTWYWRVAATDDAGNVSDWSVAGSFVIDITPPAAPALAPPANNAVRASSTVTFNWLAVSDAVDYALDISSTSNFSTYERTSAIAALSRTVTLADGDWYWRVLARDAAGNLTPTAGANARKVTIDTEAPATPTLTAVTTPTNAAKPALTWTRVAGASVYVLTLDATKVEIPDPATGTTASYTPTTNLADGTHTWTVLARDAAANAGPAAPAQSFEVDTTAPGTPEPVTYAPNPTSDNTPTLSWSAVAGAARYLVEWDTATTFNTSNKGSTEPAAPQATPGPLSNTTWYWRVRSSDALGNASAWASTEQLTVDAQAPGAPTPTSPNDGATATSASVEFQWSTVSDATSYRVQVATDATLSTIVQDLPKTGESAITSTSKSVTLRPDGTYYWRVLAIDAAGNQTPLASATIRTVVVDANAPNTPTLAAVTTPSNNARPTFSWSNESSSGAASYRITVDSTNTDVSATSFQPSSDLGSGLHTVSVRALDSANNASPPSAAQSFRVDLAAPTDPGAPTPSGTVGTASVTLSWSASTDAVGPVTYDVQVGVSPSNFGTLAYSASPSVTTAAVALQDGTYQWRVRARDAAGNASGWAPSANGHSLVVDTQAPTAPDLVAVGSLVRESPRLAWSSSAQTGAATYDLQVSTASTFGTTVLSLTGLTATDRQTTLADGTYYWRVRALDAAANPSAWSTSTTTFTLDTGAPGIIAPSAPLATLKSTSRDVVFTWAAVSDASEYVLLIARDAAFVSGAETYRLTGTTATVTMPSDGTFFWRMRAIDAAGNTSAWRAVGGASSASFLVDTVAPARPDAVSGPSWLRSGQTTYTIAWTDRSDSGAVSYRYEVSALTTFATTITAASTASGSVTSVGLGTPATDGTYYWRVRADDVAGNASPWSATQSFGVDKLPPATPSLSSPAMSATLNSSLVDFTWTNDTSQITTYRLQIGQEATFTNQVVVDATVTARNQGDSSVTSTQSLGQGQYYWRAVASDAAGNTVGSTPRAFTIDTTPPAATSFLAFTSPTSDQKPNPSWSAVADAAAYVVEISAGAAFTTSAHSPQFPATLAAARTALVDTDFSAAGLADGTYYVRVFVRDAAGNLSGASPALRIDVDRTAPAVVASLDYPPSAQSIPPSRLRFDFTRPVGDTGATYEIEALSGSTVVLTETCAVGTSCALAGSTAASLAAANKLMTEGAYTWRVRAVDAAGNPSAWVPATPRTFIIDATAPDVPVPLSPEAAAATNDCTPTLTWTQEAGASNYQLWVKRRSGTSWASVTGYSPKNVTTNSETVDLGASCDNRYQFNVSAVDSAGNTSSASAMSEFLIDTVAPPRPSLLSVEARNRAARVFWSAGADTAFGTSPASGLEAFEIWCNQEGIAPTKCADASATATEAWVLNLANKRDYSFTIRSKDHAGNVSGDSLPLSAPVGWVRSAVPIQSVYPVRPLAVAAREDSIFVTYMETDAEWNLTKGNLKIAVSNDGGQRWSFRTLDSSFGWSRDSAPIALTDNGIVVASIGASQSLNGIGSSPATAWDDRGPLNVWGSTDDGDTWQDISYSNLSTTTNWAHTGGLGLWAFGDRVAATYLLGADSPSLIRTTASDRGASSTLGFPSDYTLVSAGSTDLRSCQANHAQTTFWRRTGLIEALTHFYVRDTAYALGEGTGTQTVASSGGTPAINPSSYAVACAEKASAPLSYAAIIDNASKLWVRRKTSPDAVWTGSLSPLRGDAATTSKPAIYAGGSNVYVVYRNATGKLAFGESSDSGSSFSSTWSVLESDATSGYFPVMSGDNTTDAVVAYTDSNGASLTVLRPAVRGLRLRPSLGVDSADLAWTQAAGIDRYQVSYGTTSAASSTSVFSSTPSHAVQTTNSSYYQVRSSDSNGMAGNEGEVWRVNGFSESTVFVPASTGTAASDSAGIAATGLNVLLMPHKGYKELATDGDLVLYASSNGGASFTKWANSTTATLRAFSPTSTGRAIVAYKATDGDLYVRSYANITSNVATSTQVFNYSSGQPVVDLLAAGSNLGTGAIVAFADNTSASKGIRIAFSSDSGSNWTLNPNTIPLQNAGWTIESVTVGRFSGSRAVVFWREELEESADLRFSEKIYYSETTIFTSTSSSAWAAPVRLYSDVSVYSIPGFTPPPSGSFSIGNDTILAASGNSAYAMLFHTTGNWSLAGRIPNLYGAITGTDYMASGGSTSAAFTFMYGDREELSPRSFSAFSTNEGHYLAYRTQVPQESVGHKLELQYCAVGCQAQRNWLRSVVRTGNAGYGINVYVAPSSDKTIYMLHVDPSESNAVKLLRGGVLYREN